MNLVLYEHLVKLPALTGLSKPAPYPHPIPLQSNGFDCGPFVCCYGFAIAQHTDFDVINPGIVRRVCFSLADRNKDSICQVKGGGPSHVNLLGFLAFDDSYVDLFCSKFIDCRRILCVSPSIARAFLCGKVEVIFNHLDFPRLVNCQHIFFPTFFSNNHWVLFHLNIPNKLFGIVDPTSCDIEPSLSIICHRMGRLVNRICVPQLNIQIIIEQPPHLTSHKLCDSGPLICGYMRCILHGATLLTINCQNIRERVIPLAFSQKKTMLSDRTSFKSKTRSATNTLTVEARIAKAHQTLEENILLPVDSFLAAVHDLIFLFRPIKPAEPFLGNNSKIRGHSDRTISELYKVNRRAAVDLVINRVPADTEPAEADLRAFLCPPEPQQAYVQPKKLHKFVKTASTFSFRPVTRQEVVQCLKSKPMSAPGPSNITYRDILFCDPDGTLVAGLLNCIIERRDEPRLWKHFHTLMIPKPHKEGQYADVSSWRPIALQECLYKILTSLLCNQLMDWVSINELLHPLQKGMGPMDGCAEHTFLLRALFQTYRNVLHKPVFVGFFDAANAFNSIFIEHILAVLSLMGVERSSVDLIGELYKDCFSSYTCGNVHIESIPAIRGVRQGCPLSMALFCIGINPVLSKIESIRTGGLLSEGYSIKCLVYADDVMLLSSDLDNLQTLTDCFSKNVKPLGMKLRPDKCSVLDLPYRKDTSLSVDGVLIPHIPLDGSVLVLGCTFTRKLRVSPDKTFGKVVHELSLVASSSLHPWQQIQVVLINILSKLTYIFRNLFITLKKLEDPGTGIECRFRHHYRRMLNLPDSSPVPYLFTAKTEGGAGLKSPTDEYFIQSVSNCFALLTCDSPLMHASVVSSLRHAAIHGVAINLLPLSESVEWLNDSIDARNVHTWWNKFQIAVKELRTRHKINIVLRAVSDTVFLMTIYQRLDLYIPKHLSIELENWLLLSFENLFRTAGFINGSNNREPVGRLLHLRRLTYLAPQFIQAISPYLNGTLFIGHVVSVCRSTVNPGLKMRKRKCVVVVTKRRNQWLTCLSDAGAWPLIGCVAMTGLFFSFRNNCVFLQTLLFMLIENASLSKANSDLTSRSTFPIRTKRSSCSLMSSVPTTLRNTFSKSIRIILTNTLL